MAHLSHEIRSPLIGVLGTAENLLQSNLTNDQRGMISSLKSSVEFVLQLSNDVLDMSKLDSGKLELDEAPFNLRWLLHDLETTHFSRFLAKKIVFIIEVDADVPHVVIGDQLRVKQILSNLLGNALKFTPIDGAIFLRVSSEKIETNNAKITFHISDTGIGIPKEKQGSIFAPYEQAESDTSRKYGGTGLGLSIAREYVKMMEGELNVESQPGVGSVFWFTASFKVELSESKKTETSKKTLRILLAEDDLLTEKMTKILLEKEGHTVLVAHTGKEAIEISLSTPLDLVLMDLHLPDLNGDEAAYLIRKGGSKLPIVAFTAHQKSDVQARVEKSGMNGIISKPVERRALISRLQEYVQ